MYGRALRMPAFVLRPHATPRLLLTYHNATNLRLRHLSTPPVQPPPPSTPPTDTRPAQPRKEDEPVPDAQTTVESTSRGTSSSPSQPEESSSSRPNADPRVGSDLGAQLQEFSHKALQDMRNRSDEFTAKVAKTFAQLGRELNKVTGYGEIEVLKRRVVEQESKIYNAREAARQAKDAYDTAVLQRAKSQREVNDLLQRKSQWTDEDVSRFTRLVREDHAREQDESRAKAAAAAAEDEVEREFSELMRVILNRYHEEQVWSDKIRSASTYGQLAVLGLNVVVFIIAIVLVEPWKRRRLAQTFERKVEEMSAQTAAVFEERTGALARRLDEQGIMLSTMLEAVQLATQVPEAVGEEVRSTERHPVDPEEGERISAKRRTDQEMLLAVTASAAAAGLLGWIGRSWLG